MHVTIANHGDGVARDANNIFLGGVVVYGASKLNAENLTLTGNGLGIQAYAGGVATVRDSTISNNGIGLYAENLSSLTVSRSTFSGNTRIGLALFYQGIANVAGSTFSGNGYGLTALANCNLTVRQSTIVSNSNGGLHLNFRLGYSQPSTLHILNNFIVRNGSSTSEVGGISAAAVSGSEIKFNTIVDNVRGSSASGVDCEGGAALAITNNLITGNTGGASNEPLSTNCKNVNSYVSKAADNTPGFVNPSTPPYDYHLTASTPATILDAVDCDGNMSDVDGNMRPQGVRCDLGADELKR